MCAGASVLVDLEVLDVDVHVDVRLPPFAIPALVPAGKRQAVSDVAICKHGLAPKLVEFDVTGMKRTRKCSTTCPATGLPVDHAQRDLLAAPSLIDETLQALDGGINVGITQEALPATAAARNLLYDQAGDGGLLHSQPPCNL